PTGQRAVRGHEPAVAPLGRRGTLDADDGGQDVRLPLGREPSRLDQDVLGAHHSARPASTSACQTLSEVTGMSMLRTPAWASASTTALTYAAGEPTVADSPTPFAPSGWWGDGVTVSASSNSGVSQAVGKR